MLTHANSRHFLITSPQRRGGLSAQLLTGICDPADSVMSGSTTSLLVRQRKRRIQDMYTIENVKDRARKVLVGMPPPRMLSRATNVRARVYAHGHVCVRARA